MSSCGCRRYSDEERPADFGGLPAIGDRIANVPFNRITGEPDDDASNEFLRLGYQFEHHFSDSWRIRNCFLYIRFDNDFVSNNWRAALNIRNLFDVDYGSVSF